MKSQEELEYFGYRTPRMFQVKVITDTMMKYIFELKHGRNHLSTIGAAGLP
jgi:hypothetical protein